MAADVKIQVAHGAAATWAEVASKIRFKLADDDLVDINDPLLVLSEALTINGTSTDATLSYWKTFRIFVEAAAIGELSNLRFFRTSIGNAGIDEFYGYASSYLEAVGNTEGNGLSGAISPIAVIPMVVAPARVTNGDGPFIGTGQFGNMVVVQWKVKPAAGVGQQSDVVYTFRYDEV